MSDFDDLELGRPSDPVRPGPPPHRGPPLLVGAVVLAIVVAAAAFALWQARRGPATVEQPARQAPSTPDARPPTRPPLGGDAEVVEVPPLDESDALVRLLVGRLSTHPAVGAWLASEGLIRRATVAVQNVAGGRSPAAHLRALAPSSGFAVRRDGTRTVIDPRSYARYDAVVDGFASFDAPSLARLYATLRPRAEEAHADLGIAGGSLDGALEGAITTLLEVPVPDEDVPVVPKGVGWAFADPRLESLNGAQKQLLRLGPRNVRVVQTELRELAAALGIPAERLPPGR